jgi:hypothetical protein
MKSGAKKPAASAALMNGGQPSLWQRWTLIEYQADLPDHKLLSPLLAAVSPSALWLSSLSTVQAVDAQLGQDRGKYHRGVLSPQRQ